MLDPRDQSDLPDPAESQAQLEPLDLRVRVDRRVRAALPDCPELPERWELRDCPAIQAHQETSAVLAYKVLWDKRDCLEVRERLEELAVSDLPAFWDNREGRDHQVRPGLRVLLVHSEVRDQAVHLERLVPQDLRVLRGQMDLLELKGCREPQAPLAIQGRLGHKGHRDPTVRQGETAQQAPKDPRVLRGQLDRPVTPDWLAKLEFQGTLVVPDLPVRLELSDPQELLDLPAVRDWLVYRDP